MRVTVLCIVAMGIASPAIADRTTASIEVAIVACEHGAAARCMAAADDMERRQISRHFRHTADELRDSGLALFDRQCSAGSASACLSYGQELVQGDEADIRRGLSSLDRGCGLGSGAACMYMGEQFLRGE